MVGGSAGVAIAGAPSREELEDAVASTGIAGPVIFVLLYILLTVFLFPGAILTAAGGALFGIALGTVLAVAGATLGATAAFLVGRRLGRTQVEQIAGKRVGAIDRWIERNGLVAVLYTRLIPLVPFNALNYAAGVSAVRLRDYVVGTAVGVVPGAFAYAALGGSFDDPTSPEFVAAAALVLVLAVGGPLVDRMLKRRGRGTPDEADDQADTV